jgi:2,4-dienoyl-CoA reductase (NADPH2)
MLNKNGVKLSLGKRVSAEDVKDFDEVVLATGIVPRKLDIPRAGSPEGGELSGCAA